MPATPPTDLALIELFSSIQGEGVFLGERQVFLRLAGCNLDCAYCDTPFAPTSHCRVEETPGGGSFYDLPNPVAREGITAVLDDWCARLPAAHHSLSLTGGEPLLHGEILAEWAPYLAKRLPLYLETNGTLPEALSPLLPHLRWISMDIKLASVSGVSTPWEEHRAFLALAAERCCQVKVVVSEATPLSEIVAASGLVHEVTPTVPLILQPLTQKRGLGILPDHLLTLELAARRCHDKVRVIPQMHPLLGVL